ncbi:putative membrane protein DUF2306 [Tamaricihabitans halophyticus]|uniref:Putative membrane protein DUF2306 n=1 Tax=Tamaricihabitans halophyticus TaxID=1262583 RepID=A0A4R2QF62_9PSEU|nr:DUF2306 domain-containing protein [Tamaricihabitans halophyticus]TCP47309.1 putative membrane protein DUF2306 [Tamaricihabitans halophyticus]
MTSRVSRPILRRPWVGPLLVGTIAFLAFTLPPYLGLDPSQSRVEPRFPGHYATLVLHIFFGSVALCTACLQVWPWLRTRYPAVHRWSGQLYVFLGVLPAGIASLWFTWRGEFGANQEVANTTLAVLWLACTIAGYRMARARRFADHREWMIRSFALSFSIVTNRLWQVVFLGMFVPGGFAGDPGSPEFAQAIGASTWVSWLVNLFIAEWWLRRTSRKRPPRNRSRPGPSPLRSSLPESSPA